MTTQEKTQSEIENPIKDNRLVCDTTFATRFLSFVKDIKVNDACSHEEKDSMVTYANRLLKYQCRTATDAEEINYLKRVGVYEGNIKPYFITHDGLELFEGKITIIYSCMKKPSHTDTVLSFRCSEANDIIKRSANRVFFVDKIKCAEYTEFNVPRISKSDLEKVGLLEPFKQKTEINNI